MKNKKNLNVSLELLKIEAKKLTTELKHWEALEAWDLWDGVETEAFVFIQKNFVFAFDLISEFVELWNAVFCHYPTAERFLNIKPAKPGV